MAKRTSTTTARAGAEAATGKRRGATHRELPSMVAGDAAPSSPMPAAPRRGRRATPPAQLRLASASGSNPTPRPRQKPATPTPTPGANDTPAATPKRSRPSGARRFSELREALTEGWEIVQPIFARPLWSATDDSRTAYNFVLRRDQATRLLTVPGTLAVERFIESHKLTVDHRS